jgi:uncharacterized repeat protein (TIGR01451 family)
MKNITTATAMTSNGQPAPAGLSTSRNSNLLQATLPGGSPIFSDPVVFNNIFWDNRAGTFVGSAVAGIGLAGDPNPVNQWDLGVSDGVGLLAPTNSILQVITGTIPDGSNIVGTDPGVVSTYDTTVRALPWRGNPRFVDILMITTDATPNLLGDYHLASGSPAVNAGAASEGGINAPTLDFDRGLRPSEGGYEIGADETPVVADLSVTKTDNLTTVSPGDQVRYTITVANAGPSAVTGASISDVFPTPSPLAGPITWTCTTTGGATCGGGGTGNGNINRTVNLPVGSTVTFTTTSGSVASSASGQLSNTASVGIPAGIFDPNLANNSATDADAILTTSNLSITKTDNRYAALPGGTVTYTIVVANGGPHAVTGASVTDTFSADFSGATWTCSATNGSACGAVTNNGNALSASLNLLNGGSATLTATATVSLSAAGSISNTATVTVPPSVIDPNLANNTATDTDIIPGPFPALGILDNFNRANGALGANWAGCTGTGVYRVDGNSAQVRSNGFVYWNASSFGANQEAYMTFSKVVPSATEHDLLLKVRNFPTNCNNPGGTASAIEVLYDPSPNPANSRIQIWTLTPTSFASPGWNLRATFTGVNFVNGDVLGARTYSDGTVIVYKNGSPIGMVNVTLPNGSVAGWPASLAAGTGQIGVWFLRNTGFAVPNDARFDDFGGGTLP